MRTSHLADATLEALDKAGLTDMAALVRTRVLTRPVMTPMLELLLTEIRAVAVHLHWSAEQKRERITWALSLAGCGHA